MRHNLLRLLMVFFLLINSWSATIFAQLKPTKAANPALVGFSEVKQLAFKDSLRLIEIFKDLHQHPELAFNERRTAEIVAKELRLLKYEVITGIGKTGVAGILHNGDGPTVMYRADMDALPIKETTALAYASTAFTKRPDGTDVPVMHACGHDAHITWLLGIARIMAVMKNRWKGTLVLIAQPAEEGANGASIMVKDGMYERGVPVPDCLLGMHTFPFATGYYSNMPGVRMAGVKTFSVTFYGVGGHGSTPHLAKDPLMMAATAVQEYQSIVNRSISSQSPHVITIGSIEAGTAANIIPTSATLKGGIRWFKESELDMMINGINQVDSGIAVANNLPKDLYPTVVTREGLHHPVKNDTVMANKVSAAIERILPGSNLNNRPAWMASEDFPNLIREGQKGVPYDYIFVGVANPLLFEKAVQSGKEYPFYNHNPNFKVDLSAIPFGTVVGATAILEMFEK